jgi:tRNA threonylcarbamoyladenosine biosynthesis protein TsaB
MRVLALDTTTPAGSIALVNDHGIVAECAGDGARTHGERLPGEVLALVERYQLALGDIDVFAVAAGPGSFTGLRIGIATVQGLAFATGRRVVAVSALEALAQIASVESGEHATIGTLIDAHRGEVFGALYRATAAPPFTPERLEGLGGPVVNRAASILRQWAAQGMEPQWLVGDGIRANVDTIQLPSSTRVVATPMLAGAIGRMATVAALRQRTISPGAIQPLYVRRPDAEVARDRRA